VKPKLWPHQERAIEFAREKRRLMLDMSMGTGKTAVALAWAEHQLDECEFDERHVLVLTRKAAIEHWEDDSAKFSKLPALALNQRTGAQRAAALGRMLNQAEVSREQHLVIVNHEAHTSKPLAKVRKRSKWGAKICRHAGASILLTGTPMPHSPLDIWAQFQMIDPSILGRSYVRFRSLYAVMGGFEGKQVIAYRNTQLLSSIIAPHTFHADDSVLDLPEVLPTNILKFDLSKRERDIYKQLNDEFEVGVEEGTVTISNALVMLLRMQQVTGGWIRPDEAEHSVHLGSSKRDVLFDDILDGLPKGTPVVVFFRFTDEIRDVLREASKRGYSPSVLMGGRSDLKDWQTGGGDLILVQIQAGESGINLSRAAHGVYYSLGFSLGDYMQSLKRLHRPGQKNAVRYYHIVGRNTVDEKVHLALEKRQKVVDSVLDEVRLRAGS
jgi:SNF2 family DNA or RNA helicase